MNSKREIPCLRAAVVAGALIASSTLARGQCEPRFLRADSNADAAVDISDGIATLSSLFLGEPLPTCLDAADTNDSGELDISDAIGTFTYLFGGGAEPPAPGTFLCGEDPTFDPLGCLAFAPCGECPCEPGSVRSCGTTDEGECALGLQTCGQDGVWGPCEGAVEPVNEACDLLDNDCEGSIDNGYDEDEDGWTTCAGDCNDENPAINPAAGTDRLDGIDNDCDTEIDEGPFATSHAASIQPIWNANCITATCHDLSNPQAGLDLTPASAFIELVNKRSGQAPIDLVEPLDPSKSYLWHKLLNTQRSVGGSGSSMPNGRPRLPEASLRIIEQWILEGAPP